MRKIDRDLDRILTRLRNLIRERNYTQLEVQETLGWGRSYISQLLTKQKSLRVEQILKILSVVEVKPEDFFGEIYQLGEMHPDKEKAPSVEPDGADAELHRLGLLLEGVVAVLKRKNLITGSDLAEAIKKARALET